MRRSRLPLSLKTLLLSATLLASAGPAWADLDDGIADNNGQLPLPSGQFITPTADPGSTFQTLNPGLPDFPNFVPNGAITTALSPNGKTLLIMTDGYNTLSNAQGDLAADGNQEYVFVYNVSNPRQPSLTQVLRPNNTFVGLVWAPDGSKFYASGGNDDQVVVYAAVTGGTGYAQSAVIPLGHKGVGIGLLQGPQAGGLAISRDGSVLVVANTLNDSISVVNTATNTVRFEYDLRPYNTTPTTGNGVAGGETVYSVAIKGDTTIYAASLRDREIVVVDISTGSPRLVTRIPVPGSPVNILLNQAQTALYVPQDNEDYVAVINTATNTVAEEIDAIAPPGLLANAGTRYTGAATNNVALSPDQNTLYITNGGANAVAIVPLAGPAPHQVTGLVPTAWYPTSVTISPDGGTMWVINNKSDPGANPGYGTSSTANLTRTTYPAGNAAQAAAFNASNQYIELLMQSGLLVAPVPSAGSLPSLTRQVATNNGYNVLSVPQDQRVMSFLHGKISHVIYIIKENRTFDQILGDLANGSNGDPALTVFGSRITPNFHRLSDRFVTLDNFFCSGEVSGNGWPWSTAARETDWNEKNIPMDYAYAPKGSTVTRDAAPYDAEGQNRNVDVGITGVAAREASRPGFTAYANTLPGGAANLLPGTNDDGAPDGSNGAVQQGYIWSTALAAGLTVRNYGFLLDLSRYSAETVGGVTIPAVLPIENPAASGTQVAFSTSPQLVPLTDIYFRGFDNNFPDVWRFEEFQREFNQFDASNTLPNLVLLRFMHDHMGNFSTAVAGVNTPETQQADDDLAVGEVAQLLSHSKNYGENTLIFVDEDDAQDGPDHVDAQRSTAYVVGPYVRQHTVVSTRYSTVNLLRTIEDILGTQHVNLNTAYQRPMTDVFDITQDPAWTYSAVASTVLSTTQVRLVGPHGDAIQFADGPMIKPLHDAAYWAHATRGFDWSAEDRVPADLYNHVLWEGLKPGVPYPTVRSGLDLRHGSEDVQHTDVAVVK
jgi:DNA-binding beta-propeller fold protein YncE